MLQGFFAAIGVGGKTEQQQVQDRYFLQKVVLGQGSFGKVVRARDKQTGEDVAVKQLDKFAMPQRGVRRADVDREIGIMKLFNHQNIVRIFDTFEDPQYISLVLEYCHGGDFGDKIKERASNIDEKQVADWMFQLCSAIGAMHEKSICHRDVKPDNFLVHVAEQTHRETLKLSDLGLSVYVPPGQMLKGQCGTPYFMAPELIVPRFGGCGYSFPVDMWAAGVCMYVIILADKNTHHFPYVTPKGEVDRERLMRGTMDFRPAGSMFWTQWTHPKGTDICRQICQAMCEPDMQRRTSAGQALRSPWMRQCVSASAAGPSSAPSGAPARRVLSPPPRKRSPERRGASRDGDGPPVQSLLKVCQQQRARGDRPSRERSFDAPRGGGRQSGEEPGSKQPRTNPPPGHMAAGQQQQGGIAAHQQQRHIGSAAQQEQRRSGSAAQQEQRQSGSAPHQQQRHSAPAVQQQQQRQNGGVAPQQQKPVRHSAGAMQYLQPAAAGAGGLQPPSSKAAMPPSPRGAMPPSPRGMCKNGCGRRSAPGVHAASGKPYDTCCRSCGMNPGNHDPDCQRMR